MAIQLDHRVIHLEWAADLPRFSRFERLPADDPASREHATAEAMRRVRREIAPYLAEGWSLDGDERTAITLATRERRVLLATPGMAGPAWTEITGATVRLRRG